MATELQYKGTVRITVPTSVGFNIKKFQKSLASLAEKLGCLKCFSGADCFFQWERDYVINPATAAALSLPAAGRGATPDTAPTVTANIPRAVSGNLSLLQKAVANIAGKLGCAPCTSGFDLRFQQEISRVNQLKVQITEAGTIG